MKINKKNNDQHNATNPKFIIFTDKDGTLDMDDNRLNEILKFISIKKGEVVLTTGRTVGDIKESLRNRNITFPRWIICDNGATIYSRDEDTYLSKKTLEGSKVRQIVEKFHQIGGNDDYIRYTDGDFIYASNQSNVIEYYKNSKAAKLDKDIYKKIMKAKDLTKVTLAGTKEQMIEIAKYADELGFWTDMDKTKFPNKEANNYRLDISQKNISKGEAVKIIIEQIKPEYGYICIGNGNNDKSMFKRAIDDGMIAAIMANSDNKELIQEMQNYQRECGKGKVIVIPKSRNLANKHLKQMAKLLLDRNRTSFVQKIRGTKPPTKTSEGYVFDGRNRANGRE